MPETDQKFGLLHLTDEELRKRYERKNGTIDFSSKDYYMELRRRAETRHDSAIRRLATVTEVPTFWWTE